jgi:hypothetical protein
MINKSLPEDLQNYGRILDKGGIRDLLMEVYKKHPDQYKEIIDELMNVGRSVAHTEGSSFALEDLRLPYELSQKREQLKAKLANLIKQGKTDEFIQVIAKERGGLQKSLYESFLKEKNPFAIQVKSGSRGNASQLLSLVLGDLLAVDHKDHPVPVPIQHGYVEGLDPAEYWASSYGTRKAVIDTKFATQEAGALGKEISSAAHRIVASDQNPIEGTGFPLEANDPDLEGYTLAKNYSSIGKRGDIITPQMAAKLRESGQSHILVNSVINTGSFGGGVPRQAFGARERGTLPVVGDNLGIPAAQAVAERLSQGMLSSKHGGGVIGSTAGVSGFDLIKRLLEVPKSAAGNATVAQNDGTVENILEAPQGGQYVYIGGERHYVSPDNPLLVKPGDKIEAGDVITEGYPNPAEIVRHKGIGEGRKQFVDIFRKALTENGINTQRRNLEIISRGLINFVRITGNTEVGGHLPGDLIDYDSLSEIWKPRDGAQKIHPSKAFNKYLEHPVLHYSIGTRITPSVAKNLKKYDVSEVTVHDNPPPFEPEMVRAMENLSKSDDWLVRFGGTNLERSLLDSVQRGRKSDLQGTSHLPAMAVGEI